MNSFENFRILILARKGSRRIKNKNLLRINNVPLVKITLNQATNLFNQNKITLSTDDMRIIQIGKTISKKIQIDKRPKKLSGNKTKSETVIKYLINKYNFSEKNIILLQPTSPFRKKNDIKKMISIYLAHNLSTLHAANIYQNKKKILSTIEIHSSVKKKNKIFSKKYSYNGSIYIFSVDYFLKEKSIYEKMPRLYLTKPRPSLDIDNLSDLKGLNYNLC